MLSDIRRMSKNTGVKILLVIIAFAFVFFGVGDILNAPSDKDLVIFKYAKNITDNQFSRERREEIAILQKQNNLSLSEQEIKDMDIDGIVLRKLIDKSILDYFATLYDLELDDKTAIKLIKQSGVFGNKDDKFDINIFYSALRQAEQTESEYLGLIKRELIIGGLLNVFANAVVIPDLMINNLTNYEDEKRKIDLVSIELNKNTALAAMSYSEPELREFYNKNIALFEVPEKRTIRYMQIPVSLAREKVVFTEAELKQFFEDNIDEFEEKEFDKSRNSAENMFRKQKTEELNSELIRHLEDDVASGLTIQEIHEKYGFNLFKYEQVSLEEMVQKNSELSNMIETIFSMQEAEVSYPVEQDQKIFLFEISKITPAGLEPFDSVKDKVSNLLRENVVHEIQLSKITDYAREYKTSSVCAENCEFKVIKNIYVSRKAPISKNHKIPKEVLDAVFAVPLNSNSQVISVGDKAYFANVNSINISDINSSKATKKRRDEVIQNIKNSMIEEMVGYFKTINKIAIRDFKS